MTPSARRPLTVRAGRWPESATRPFGPGVAVGVGWRLTAELSSPAREHG
jgi:hypothetical protein